MVTDRATDLEVESVEVVLGDRRASRFGESADPGDNLLERLRHELVVSLSTAVGRRDQPSVPEHPQVAAHSRAGDTATLGQVHDPGRAGPTQLLEQSAPHRVADGGEDIHAHR